MRSYLTSNNRGISLGLLLLICCGAAARTPQDPAGQAWPREIDSPSGKIVVFEPQVDSLKGTKLTSRAAVSVTKKGADPVFGGFWMESTLSIDANRRTAQTVTVRVTEVRFPNAGAVETEAFRREIAAEIARWNLSYTMDSLLAQLKELEDRRAQAQGLKADVPEIHFRSHPAVLLSIQGEPAWRAAPGNALRRLENASHFVVQDEAEICYLHVAPYWWRAKSALGPWEETDDVPAAVDQLWRSEPKPQLPAPDGVQEAPRRPEVIVATGPAELIWTDGLPRYAPIGATDLLYVTNTESDVFLLISSQDTYVLLSGRWYRTPASKVAWEFVPSDELPSDFARIPLSSEKAHVLACVAGTRQAREALLDAEIPQTESVSPGPAPDLQATYDGEPRFDEISGSSVHYAVNTPSSIFRVQRRYYWCYGGIWYDSDWSVGPWAVCTWVPPAIYLIPPSCPYYYVTYCRIFGVTPRSVYYGYYPGYRGCYVWGRSVVYGTGYRYSCWSGNYWYSRPVTWGVCVRYTPRHCGWTGVWGLRRPSSGYVLRDQAPVGGWWGADAQRRRTGVEGYRVVTDSRTASATTANLYVRQPERLAPNPDRPPARRETPNLLETPRVGRDLPRTVPPGRERREETPSSREERERPLPLPKDLLPREESPRTPPSREERETPRLPTLPRNPSPPSREEREAPRTPQSREERESPRTPPSLPRDPLPPSREEREAPRTPPLPPPRERREEGPRTPPAPPIERREEGPRTPPPPPPRERREEPPRIPPIPPPRERRESPPPPPPPPPRREEGPRNPPPPPRREEGPRNPPPPPPPPPRERREPPPPPPRHEERREDRRRNAPQLPSTPPKVLRTAS